MLSALNRTKIFLPGELLHYSKTTSHNNLYIILKVFGSLFGAGVFVTTCVAGAVSIAKPFKLMERPFLRCFFLFFLGFVFSRSLLFANVDVLVERKLSDFISQGCDLLPSRWILGVFHLLE